MIHKFIQKITYHTLFLLKYYLAFFYNKILTLHDVFMILDFIIENKIKRTELNLTMISNWMNYFNKENYTETSIFNYNNKCIAASCCILKNIGHSSLVNPCPCGESNRMTVMNLIYHSASECGGSEIG